MELGHAVAEVHGLVAVRHTSSLNLRKMLFVLQWSSAASVLNPEFLTAGDGMKPDTGVRPTPVGGSAVIRERCRPL